jgi:tetratricopeptide (TPR) repeat protein
LAKLFLLFSAALALSPAPAASPAKEARKVFERENATMTQAKALVIQHRAAEALPISEKLIADIDARLADEKRRIYSGQTISMVMANMTLAATAKESAIDVGPALGDALFYEGFALIEVGRADEAGTYLERAVSVSPTNPQFLCEAASWHSQRREFDRARELYKDCEGASGMAESGPASERFRGAAQRGQGFVLIEEGRFEEAEVIYRARLKSDPEDKIAAGELRFIEQQRAKAAKQKT